MHRSARLFACLVVPLLFAGLFVSSTEARTNFTFPAELGEVNVGLDSLASSVPFSSVFAAENVQTEDDGTMSFDVVAVKTTGGEWQEVTNTTFTVIREIRGPEDLSLPQVHVVQKGETLTAIANRYGVTVDQLIRWNRRTVIVGEPIYVSDPHGFDRWVFVGADPSAHTMLEQVDMMPTLPDAVRPIMRQQVATVMPDTVFVPRSLILHDEIEGGLVTKEVKVKELSLALWIDRKTGQPIESLPALAYPPVFYEGQAYTLLRFLDCGNGAYLRQPYRLEVISEVTPRIVTAPPETTETDTTPFVPAIAEPEKVIEPLFRMNWVAWLYPEYVSLSQSMDRVQAFSGAEVVTRIGRKGYHSPHAVILRGHVNRVNTYDWSFLARGGYRFGWVDRPAGFNLEAGGWLETNQRSFRLMEQVSPTQLRWEEQATYFDGSGPYGRLLLWASHPSTYADITLRTGNSLRQEWSTSLTVEPGRAYLRGGWQQTLRKAASESYQDTTISFPSDRIDIFEMRIGRQFGSLIEGSNGVPELVAGLTPKRVRPDNRRRHVLYGAGYYMDYRSSVWEFEWPGFGAGYEYRRSSRFKAELAVKYFPNTDSHDLVNDIVYEDEDQIRFLGGIVISR